MQCYCTSIIARAPKADIAFCVCPPPPPWFGDNDPLILLFLSREVLSWTIPRILRCPRYHAGTWHVFHVDKINFFVRIADEHLTPWGMLEEVCVQGGAFLVILHLRVILLF